MRILLKPAIWWFLLVAAFTTNVNAEVYSIDPEVSPQLIDSGVFIAQFDQVPDQQESSDPDFFPGVIRPSFEQQIISGGSAKDRISWEPVPDYSVQLPLNTPVAWLALQIKNPTDSQLDYLLELRGFGSVSWFLVDESGLVNSHSDDLQATRSGREYYDPVAVLPIKLAPGETQQLYMGLYVSVSAVWNLVLWEVPDFLEDRLSNMMWDGLYFGLVFTLLLFCMVVYFNIREPLYLFFALFLGGAAAVVYFASGLHTQFLLADHVDKGLIFLFLSTGLVDFAAAVFSILLLRIHLINMTLYRAWLAVIGFNIANIVYAIWLSTPGRVALNDPGYLGISSLAATILEQCIYIWTLVAFWRSSPVARYWFLVIMSNSAVLIYWSIYSNFPDASWVDPKRLTQAVMVLGAVVLCVVLAYMYRLERSERLAAQDLSIENLRLARDIEQARANFISTVSHDLHGPVRAIGFFAESLKGKVDSDAETNVQRIEENVETVSALLDSLVKLSEANAPAQLSVETISLGEILYTLKNEFSPIARSKHLILSVPDSQLEVQTDRVALSQVLRNLIDNALKYTDAGFVKVEVEERSEVVSVMILDSGKGIHEDDLERVFQEFYQVSSTDSDGVGLGLSIVARLTSLLGIHLNVGSKVGEGTRFELLLPKEFSPTIEQKPIAKVFSARIDLTAFVFDEADDELTEVAAHLQSWGVDLVSDAAYFDDADFVLVPGSVEGLRWVNQLTTDKWIVMIGNVSGFEPPHVNYVVLSPDVEPMKLRGVIQRVLQSRQVS